MKKVTESVATSIYWTPLNKRYLLPPVSKQRKFQRWHLHQDKLNCFPRNTFSNNIPYTAIICSRFYAVDFMQCITICLYRINLPAIVMLVDWLVAVVIWVQCLSPMNPSGQTQEYEPNVFLQILFRCWHIVEFWAHSTISTHDFGNIWFVPLLVSEDLSKFCEISQNCERWYAFLLFSIMIGWVAWSSFGE